MMSDALCLSSNRTALTGGMRVGKQGIIYCNDDAFRFGTIAMPLSGCLWVNSGFDIHQAA